MSTQILSTTLATWVNAGSSTTKFDTATRLGVRTGGSGTSYTLINFVLPGPVMPTLGLAGATVSNAKLAFYTEAIAATDAHTITARMLNQSWSPSTVTYSTRPTALQSVDRSVTKTGAQADKTKWEIDVTADIQLVANGAKWYGWRLSIDDSLLSYIYSEINPNIAYRPTLEVTWSDAPKKPTGLNPSGGLAVNPAKPTLKANFIDLSGSVTVGSVQVQLAASSAALIANTPSFDTGMVPTTVPELNLGDLFPRTATIGTTNTSTTITAATATFASSDVGATITGTGIPALATITAVASGTSATISAAATATGSISATITRSYAGLADGSTIFWRIQFWDGAGLPSGWSDVASFSRDTKGVITINSPSAGTPVVEDATPPILWSFTGETQTAYELVISTIGNGFTKLHTFESTTESFAAVGATTAVSRNTTSPLIGTGDLLLTWTTAGTVGVSRTYTGTDLLSGVKKVEVGFKLITTDTTVSGTRAILVRFYNTAGVLQGTNTLTWPGANVATDFTTSFNLPTGQDFGKVEIMLQGTTASKQARFDNILVTQYTTTTALNKTWSSGKVTSTDQSVTIPTGVILGENQTHTVYVRVWDAKARVETVGDPIYAEASRDFVFTPGATTGVTDLVVTTPNPEPMAILTWTRATAPDWFNIKRNGQQFRSKILPEDLFVSGTTYQFTDTYHPDPYRPITHEIQAVVNNVASATNNVASTVLKSKGIWLRPYNTSEWLFMAGAEQREFTVSEQSAVLESLDGKKTVVTQSLGGFEGEIKGTLIDYYGKSAQEWRDIFFDFRKRGGRFWLTTGEYTMLVALTEFKYAQRTIPKPTFDVSFNFYQQDSLDSLELGFEN